jgi:uncharacterized protein (DUF488 family)
MSICGRSVRRRKAVKPRAPEAELAFEQADTRAERQFAALLCYERDVAHCHRALLAERLAARGYDIIDL